MNFLFPCISPFQHRPGLNAFDPLRNPCQPKIRYVQPDHHHHYQINAVILPKRVSLQLSISRKIVGKSYAKGRCARLELVLTTTTCQHSWSSSSHQLLTSWQVGKPLTNLFSPLFTKTENSSPLIRKTPPEGITCQNTVHEATHPHWSYIFFKSFSPRLQPCWFFNTHTAFFTTRTKHRTFKSFEQTNLWSRKLYSQFTEKNKYSNIAVTEKTSTESLTWKTKKQILIVLSSLWMQMAT